MTDIDAETQALQDWGEEGRATQRAIDEALATTRAELAAKDAEIARWKSAHGSATRLIEEKDATIHQLGENAAKAARGMEKSDG